MVGTPKNGERSDQHQAVRMLLRFCGCCARPWQSRLTATAAFTLTLSGTLLVNVRPGRASFFPELVRFPPLACLSCRSPGRRPESQGADMGLMSLNGIKLVVTFLASPARIWLRSDPSRYLHELEYSSPVILSRGFCTSRARKIIITQSDHRNARHSFMTERSERMSEEASFSPSAHHSAYASKPHFPLQHSPISVNFRTVLK